MALPTISERFSGRPLARPYAPVLPCLAHSRSVNGDVFAYEDIARALHGSGASSVMVARGAMQVSLVPVRMWQGVRAVPVRMWQGVRAVPVQMW